MSAEGRHRHFYRSVSVLDNQRPWRGSQLYCCHQSRGAVERAHLLCCFSYASLPYHLGRSSTNHSAPPFNGKVYIPPDFLMSCSVSVLSKGKQRILAPVGLNHISECTFTVNNSVAYPSSLTFFSFFLGGNTWHGFGFQSSPSQSLLHRLKSFRVNNQNFHLCNLCLSPRQHILYDLLKSTFLFLLWESLWLQWKIAVELMSIQIM